MKKIQPDHYVFKKIHAVKNKRSGLYVCVDVDSVSLYEGPYSEDVVKFSSRVKALEYIQNCYSGVYKDCNLDAEHWIPVLVEDFVGVYPTKRKNDRKI